MVLMEEVARKSKGHRRAATTKHRAMPEYDERRKGRMVNCLASMSTDHPSFEVVDSGQHGFSEEALL